MADAPDPESPQAAAAAWVDRVLRGQDLAGAWPATDPQLRLVLAQDWVWNHRHDPAIGHDRDWDEVANGLAAGPGGHPLWDRFASDLLTMWERTWRGFGTEAWTVRDTPEILDLDLEMVTFVEAETGLARRFVLRHDHGAQATQADHGVQATQADDGVQATQADDGVQATQADDGVQATQADDGVQATQADDGVQATQADDGVQATQAGGKGQWLVASVSGDQLFEPGWPPRQGRPAGQQ